MTYQTAYKLLVAAYKSAKGIMPEGLDLLKIKQKARQKVIDAKKVIQFPPERITNPFKARPTETEIMMKQEGIPVTVKGKTTTMTPDSILKMLMGKGKGKDVKIGQAPKTTKRKPAVDPKLTQEENIKRIMAENKASAKRLQEKMNKPEKSLGEKLKDYDGDPDAMANGGKVKKPFRSKVVDFLGGPSVVGAELGLSGLLEVYNLLGMPLMKDGGIMKLATGGMTNISDTYDNNPTLQSQYPNKQDYLDLFAQQTTTTPQYATAYQSTGSTNAINPNIKQIKPIIPIPESGDGGGGITTIDRGLRTADQYAGVGPYSNPDGTPFNDPTTQEEIDELNKGSGLMNLLSLGPTIKAGKFVFDKAKAGAAATKKAIDNYFAKKAAEKAAKEKEINRIQRIIDSGSSVDKATGGQFGTSVNEPTGSRGSGTGFSNYS